MSLFLWRFCIRSVNSAVVFHGPSATEHAGPELKYSIATAAKCLFNVPVLIYLCISFCKTLTLYSHGHYWSKIVFFFLFFFFKKSTNTNYTLFPRTWLSRQLSCISPSFFNLPVMFGSNLTNEKTHRYRVLHPIVSSLYDILHSMHLNI